MTYKIVIPSRGRAKEIQSDTLALIPKDKIKDTIVYVNPSSQISEYKQRNIHLGATFVGLDGDNITEIRSQILDNFNEGDKILMMDDDIVGKYNSEGLEQGRFKSQEIEDYFKIIESLGTNIFGFEPTGNKMNLSPKPCFSGFGFCIQVVGIIKSDIKYDESLELKEDIEFSCQHLKKYRYAPVFYHTTFRGRTVTNKGGCQDYRCIEKEREACMYILRKHGDCVKPHKKDGQLQVIKQYRTRAYI